MFSHCGSFLTLGHRNRSRPFTATVILIAPNPNLARRAIQKQTLINNVCTSASMCLVHPQKPPQTTGQNGTAVAREPALPWAAGQLLTRYFANRSAGNTVALEASPTSTIVELVVSKGQWTGTCQELLLVLQEQVGGAIGKSKGFPTSPRGLAGGITRCVPNLRALGINCCDSGHDSRTRRRSCRICRDPSRPL